MCGITGIIAPKTRDKRQIIEEMTGVLTHRGPDESGYYHADGISLGQRRLSIIDLEGGRQPISNEDAQLQLVCNGEIYNSPDLRKELLAKGHIFKTATDVEVILHLYEELGIECVKRLQGMFAFALWDDHRKRLFLARDHLGQKPIFFYRKDDTFIFASEIKAILASRLVGPELDLDSLWHYVSLRFIPDDCSLFKNIHKLTAASWLCLENGKITVQRYWDISFKDKLKGNEHEIADQLDAILRDTVKSHLLSDVRVGSFLSGGIDSSTVCAIMAGQLKEPVASFSIGVKEQQFNELPYAGLVAKKYALDAHQEVVSADLVNLLPAMVYHMEEPADPFGVGVFLVAQSARGKIKVVLSGDGGDENFAGYDRFLGNSLVDFYGYLPAWLRKNVLRGIIRKIPESFGYKSLEQKLLWLDEMSFFKHGERYAHSMSFLRFSDEAKSGLFTPDARKRVNDVDSARKIIRYFD
ncbi:asparagine synthetase, partial [sediment metagenome]